MLPPDIPFANDNPSEHTRAWFAAARHAVLRDPHARARGARLDRLATLEPCLAAFELRLARRERQLTILLWLVGLHLIVSLAGVGLVLNQLPALPARVP